MISFFRRLRWNTHFRDELKLCMEYVHKRYFASLERGKSRMDGMSGDVSLFLWATVESVTNNGKRIRVDYSVKCKGTIDATGSYRLLHVDGSVDELPQIASETVGARSSS